MGFYIVKVTSDNKIEPIKKESADLDLKELQEMVGGYIEAVSPILIRELDPYMRMLVNESGKIYDLPANRMGTALYGNPYDGIVGDIVLCTTFNADPEADPDLYAFDQADFERLMKWLPRLMKKIESVPV